MKKLLEYLINTDELAGDFYGQAIATEDKNAEASLSLSELPRLFASLSGSRFKSRNNLLNAANNKTLTSENPFNAEFMALFKEKSSLLLDSDITRLKENGTIEELLDFTLDMEIYTSGKLYSKAIETLKEHSRSFISIAATTQWRRRIVETFIAAIPGYNHHLESIQNIPRIWTENLLVVDDCKTTTMLLSDTLSGEGSVHTAKNGSIALDRLKDKYFAAIITDVSMPVMGGVDLYKAAADKYPGIRRRFIFFTDTASMKDVNFFKSNKINYLPKPASIKDIRRTVLKVMRQY